MEKYFGSVVLKKNKLPEQREVRIEDIPEGKHKDELIKLAEKYEYELY